MSKRRDVGRWRDTRDFCRLFARIPDPIVSEVTKNTQEDESIAWLVLGTAIQQWTSMPGVVDVLRLLRRRYPQGECFLLPTPAHKSMIEAIHQQGWTRDWPLVEHVPGIAASIGHWMRRYPDGLMPALIRMDTAQLWRELSCIYYMGKNSITRPKAIYAIHRMRARSPLGLGIPIRETPMRPRPSWPFPVTSGARRWFKSFGTGADLETMSEIQKFSFFQKLYGAINPGDPELIAHGLSFFLESSGSEKCCRLQLGGCSHCPLGTSVNGEHTCPGSML
ncbi:MAG TPA: hypothetical protein VLM37_03490 [Fibrobacteraceae bacterium]|nr:hypothetical protein [Fibrobacteraceae bacterium]